MDGELLAIDTCLGGKVSHFLKRIDERRATVGIAGVVHSVDADEDVATAFDLRNAKAYERKIVFRAGT